MPAASELVAHGRTVDEVREIIGADRMIYQDLQDLIEAVQKKGKTDIERFDTSVFNGEYVTGDINETYLEQLELLRNDGAKSKSEAVDRSILDLHNDV
jgi:amidophosphoribosyltransferase